MSIETRNRKVIGRSSLSHIVSDVVPNDFPKMFKSFGSSDSGSTSRTSAMVGLAMTTRPIGLLVSSSLAWPMTASSSASGSWNRSMRPSV